MSRKIIFISFLTILVSCANFPNAPDKEKLAKYERAYLVPLEDPPIGVDPTFSFVLPGVGGTLGYTQAAGIFNSISVLAQLPGAINKAELIGKALEQEFKAKEPWSPCLILANMAADKIIAYGIPTTVSKNPLHLASHTNSEINKWYNENGPILNYREISLNNSPYVLEIMQSNGLLQKSLMVEVRMKLIDPVSGTVLGRKREWEIVDIPSYEQLFTDNGRVYKEILLTSERQLMHKVLMYLGLIDNE